MYVSNEQHQSARKLKGNNMKKYEFKPITINDIPSMATLLVERQKQEPAYLQKTCLQENDVIQTLRELFNNHKMVGMGAVFNDELVGYMFAKIEIDTERGSNAWVLYEGMAIKQDESVELIRHLYAHASELWLDHGCFKHYAMVPLGTPGYQNAFQGLSFAIEQVHAVMNMNDYEPFEESSEAIIRYGNEKDREELVQMSSIIFSYQNSSPTYEPAFPETVKKIREGYGGIVDDEEAVVLLAEKGSKVIGFQAYWPQGPGLMFPKNAVELSVAGTYSFERGAGVGKALMNEGYRIMKAEGYDFMITDWRIANLTSSTFWPKCGFQPIIYRMVRNIDDRLAWANFDNPLVNEKK
jgi:GNAT superfamily N-acetyltransferase